MAFCEKAGSCVATGIGSSEDSSEAFFASLASLSMVPKSVGDDLATGKLTAAALHWESNTEVQNTLLVINDSANVIQEEPVCIDGSASGKFKWHQKFRDDKERMDGGEGPIIEGAEVDNLRLDLDPNCADFGDPKSLWATTEKVLGLPVVAQLQLDNRKEGLGGPFYLCRLEDKAGEHLLFEPGPREMVRDSQIQNKNRILQDHLHRLEPDAPITSSTRIWDFLLQLGIMENMSEEQMIWRIEEIESSDAKLFADYMHNDDGRCDRECDGFL
ncbi:hypothetical protein Ancab_012721 [Ancistrocladus abbreviatus]